MQLQIVAKYYHGCISGTVCPAALLVALGFIDCRQVVAAITIDILGIASMGFQYSGFLVNHLDIYPKYAGVAIALCNSVGAVAELVAPLLVDAITKEVGYYLCISLNGLLEWFQ